jgi:hypothetical protein
MFGALSQQPPGEASVPIGLGWWWHTPDDLFDKLDEANLVRDTRVFVHTVWRLLADRILPIDYAAHARALLVELDLLAASLGQRFSVQPLIESAHALRDKADNLAARAAGLDAATVNTALMRVSRALVPMDYTQGDRFTHDPALPQPPWPTLQPLRNLAATKEGSDAAQFHIVSAMRARNRVAHALREANAALDAALHAP